MEILEKKQTYLVVWRGDGPVVQSKVTSYLNPEQLTNKLWMQLAALAEGDDPEEITSWDVYLVIPYPEKFYV